MSASWYMRPFHERMGLAKPRLMVGTGGRVWYAQSVSTQGAKLYAVGKTAKGAYFNLGIYFGLAPYPEA